MYEKVPLKTIMILVTTAILIVPWAALAALARAVGSCQYRPGRAQPGARCRWIFAPRVERRASRRG